MPGPAVLSIGVVPVLESSIGSFELSPFLWQARRLWALCFLSFETIFVGSLDLEKSAVMEAS